MRVSVLLFGVLREKAGRARLAVEVPDGATVADAVAAAGLDAATLQRSVRPAANREYCEWSRLLAEGDEVALIPPVSGG